MSEHPGALPRSEPGDFDIRTCFSEAWVATWAGFPGWLLALIIAGVGVTLATFTIIGIVLVVPVLAWGSVLYFVNLYDRREALSDLFAGFSRYSEALVGMLLTVFAMIVISFVGQVISLAGEWTDSALLMGVGALVNVLWAIFVVPRFYFAYLYVVDRGENPLEAVTGAWERTTKVKWKVAGLSVLSSLVMLGIAVPAILVVGATVVGSGGGASNPLPVVLSGALVALLLTAPVVFFYLVWISAYRQMEGRSAPPMRP